MNVADTQEDVNTNPITRGARITDYLDVNRIDLDIEVTSRKRLFEHIAETTSQGLGGVDEDCVFRTIAERERLGSTGLGKGVAVPHGRIENLEEPVVSLVRLKYPIDYDAPDGQPIWLAIGLLVPAEANHAHLQLLANLAASFQKADFMRSLRECDTRQQVVRLFRGV